EVWGGGRRGGNLTSSGRAGGGGGGGYSKLTIDVTPGEAIGVYIGKGGDQNIANGEKSFVTKDNSLPYTSGIVYANGGNNGTSLASGQGGAAVLVSEITGIISFKGGDGAKITN